MLKLNYKIMGKLLELITETDLTKLEVEWLDCTLKNIFDDSESKVECRIILDIRKKMNMEIQENFMISDYEYHFNDKFKK